MWNQKALSAAPVTPAKLAIVGEKVMEKCDAIDGLRDGLIDDPRKCAFDPARDVPAVAKNGPNTPEFFRLFMAPGMAHCGGGIGPDATIR